MHFFLARGGLLSGNVQGKDAPVEKGARYDPETTAGQVMRRYFLAGTEMEAVEYLQSIVVRSFEFNAFHFSTRL